MLRLVSIPWGVCWRSRAAWQNRAATGARLGGLSGARKLRFRSSPATRLSIARVPPAGRVSAPASEWRRLEGGAGHHTSRPTPVRARRSPAPVPVRPARRDTMPARRDTFPRRWTDTRGPGQRGEAGFECRPTLSRTQHPRNDRLDTAGPAEPRDAGDPDPGLRQGGVLQSRRLVKDGSVGDDRGRRARGRLKPGGLIVEATSGNTGVGLALAPR